MAAEAHEQLFDLFEFYWFTYRIFSKTQNPPPQIHIIEESIAETNENLDFLGVSAINIRSYSDQLVINSKQLRDSVVNLETPKLETIFSGKEVKEIEIRSPVNEKNRVLGTGRGRKRYYKTSKNKSKSLSELEFEEVKGFMDLGFLFSEKDKESNLVSIIPGLQRLGEKEKEEEKDDDGGCRRPYLSQAWDDLEEPIIIPATLGNDLEVKHQLKFWAHSVASAVR